jgi:hypothetical protein
MFGANHPLTLDYAARVAAVGGSLPVSAYWAYNYLFSSLVNTMGLNPADLYLHTFDGGINGIVVPAFNRSGAIGNATNVGYVSGDYSDSGGLVQSGGKYLDSLLTLSHLQIVCYAYSAYYAGLVSGERILLGAVVTLTGSIRIGHMSDFWSNSAFASLGNDVSAIDTIVGNLATASGRIAFASATATDLRFFLNGSQQGPTKTNARTFAGASANISFGSYRFNNNISNYANATQVFSLIGTGPLTPTQMAQLDAIVREFLIRRGRPPCD